MLQRSRKSSPMLAGLGKLDGMVSGNGSLCEPELS